MLAQVVVAVKDLPEAKTRLAPVLDAPRRAALVLAMLTDTVAAARRCPQVLAVHVVTADPRVAETARHLGVAVLADTTSTLNAALTGATARLDPSLAVLALQGDLPALRPGELAQVLRGADRRCAVADAAGTGTTALLAPAGTALEPCFGPASAAAHAASGAELVEGPLPGLRTDVDTVADLAAAVRAGLGPATAALLDAAGTAATVAAIPTGGVELRTDDGVLVHCPAAVAAAGGWVAPRVGQRLRVHTGADGAVFLLTSALRAPG